jgi:F0F1-type ATP synthase membrane subunit c/vacuolar-type H+-ATPase subunit K
LPSFLAFVAGLAVGLVCGTTIGVLFMAALVAASRRPPN